MGNKQRTPNPVNADLYTLCRGVPSGPRPSIQLAIDLCDIVRKTGVRLELTKTGLESMRPLFEEYGMGIRSKRAYSELDLLEAIVDGMTRRQIADRYHLTPEAISYTLRIINPLLDVLNLEVRNGRVRFSNEDLIKGIKEGLTRKGLAERFGITIPSVCYRINAIQHILDEMELKVTSGRGLLRNGPWISESSPTNLS